MHNTKWKVLRKEKVYLVSTHKGIITAVKQKQSELAKKFYPE
jgi:hypothetical protein